MTCLCFQTLRVPRSLAQRLCMRGMHMQWPSNLNPSPYEIFGLTRETFSPKALRSAYIELAKMYHPDKRNTKISDSLRAERFKKVVAAHDILKDDSKRRRLDFTHGGPGGSVHPDMRMYNDFYSNPQYNKHWGFAPQEDFNRNLKDNRMFLLKVVVASAICLVAAELTAMFKLTDHRAMEFENQSREVSIMHLSAVDNYGLGGGADARVRRFLAARDRTLERKTDFSYSSLVSDGP